MLFVRGQNAGEFGKVEHVIAGVVLRHARLVGQIVKLQRLPGLPQLLVEQVGKDIKLIGRAILVLLHDQHAVRPIVGTEG
jgi:hypothetical protein